MTGDEEDIYAVLAGAWRARRSPELARLAGLASQLRPPPIRAKLDGLAANRVAIVMARLGELANEDDPLFANWVMHALEAPPFTSPSARPLLEALIEAAARMRDPRLVSRRDAIARVFEVRVKIKTTSEALIARLHQAAEKVASMAAGAGLDLATEGAGAAMDPQITAIAARLDGVTKENQKHADLLAAIYANPLDDAPRLVLADYLLERGDPLGEFINLQFQRRNGLGTEASVARENELMTKHAKSWLGRLAPAITLRSQDARSTFERGFLATAFVSGSARRAKKKSPLLAVIDDPSWAVVEQVIDSVNSAYLLWNDEVLYRAPLRGLRRLCLTREQLVKIDEHGRIFPRLDWVVLVEADGTDWGVVRKVFPELAAFYVSFDARRYLERDVVREVVATVDARRVVFRISYAGVRSPLRELDDLAQALYDVVPNAPEIAIEVYWHTHRETDTHEIRVVDGHYVMVPT